jgi:FkbM family methyltransferase
MYLRNGKKVKIENFRDLSNFWENFWKSKEYLAYLQDKGIRFVKRKNEIEFEYNQHLIKFYFPSDSDILGHIASAYRQEFIEQPYSWLNVKGKEVVDGGASIGDTAIYFALNGARHVYAFEPYPSSYKIALKNIKLNKLEKKVTLLNEAIGKENKTIYIDENYKSDIGEDLKEFKRGKKIKVTTLEEIVEKFKLKDAVLKMNCEGCEYCSILNTPNEILRNFEQIMLQYHYGYLNLKKKLEEAGFKVKISIPQYFINEKAQNPYLVSGHLYAQRLS